MRRLWKWLIWFCNTPWAEAMTWVGTLFGGIVVSQGDPDRIGPWVWGGVSVTLGVLPLIIKGIDTTRLAKRDDEFDAREEVANSFATDTIQELADTENTARKLRVAKAEEMREGIVDHIHQQYFSDNPNVRVILYELTDDQQHLVPKYWAGERGKPGTFTLDNQSGAAIRKLQSTTEDFEYRSTRESGEYRLDKPRNGYRAYISYYVRSTDYAYGMLSVDSSKAADLDKRDTVALGIYASLLAFYIAAEARGKKHQQRGGENSDERSGQDQADAGND